VQLGTGPKTRRLVVALDKFTKLDY
jgi:hypothetical protein